MVIFVSDIRHAIPVCISFSNDWVAMEVGIPGINGTIEVLVRFGAKNNSIQIPKPEVKRSIEVPVIFRQGHEIVRVVKDRVRLTISIMIFGDNSLPDSWVVASALPQRACDNPYHQPGKTVQDDHARTLRQSQEHDR